MSRLRVGVDVGGTFTDIVIWDQMQSQMHVHKVPSVKRDPAEGVISGVRAALHAAGATPDQVATFVNGTTVAVNTLIERSGAPAGLLVTRGFRDILELRRVRLPGAPSYEADKPRALVQRRHVKEVGERLRWDGVPLADLPWAEVEQALAELTAGGVEAVAVCFLHSYRNPAHEQAVKSWIAARYPGLYVCTSSEVWPQQREYERCLVTVVNAYVGSIMQTYFQGLQDRLQQAGVTSHVLSTKSNGGVMSARAAGEAPIQTLLSGPASGLIAALHLARLAGYPNVVTFDMGGTSTDVGVVPGQIPYSTENTVGDFPVVLPSVDVTSVGAGGGSMLWVDEVGSLRVGPRSAGSVPGPACYGQGGKVPTITDCYVALGLVAPDDFLGGSFRLQPDLALAALTELGRQLGVGPHAVAQAAVELATATMYAELLPLLAARGVDRKEFALMAFGGAGPTHAFLLAREAGFERIIVPPTPGALCALGCVLADFRADFVRTVYARYDHSIDRLVEQFSALEQEAGAWLAQEGVDMQQRLMTRTVDVRYQGQSYELTVDLAGGDAAAAVANIPAAFARDYAAVYGYVQEAAPLEVVNLRVQAVGITPKPAWEAPPAASPEPLQPAGWREIHYSVRAELIPVYQRHTLRPGHTFTGPAIISQYDTTIFVPGGFRATVDGLLNVIGESA